MDMREPLNFEVKSPVVDTALTSPARGGILTTLAFVFASLAWLFMNIWAVNIVANGIWSVKLFPPSFGENMVLLFALSLQAIPALFGLVSPLFFTRWYFPPLWLMVLAVCALIMGFEMYHSVYAQYKNSTGTALFAQERAEVDALSRKLTETSAQLVSTYKTKTKAYDDLAEAAAQGRDESGIAKCEAICKEFRRKFADATARYSHLGMAAAAAPAVLAPDADLRERLTDIESRSSKLAAAAKDLSAFYMALDKSTPPAMLIDEIASIATAVNAKMQRFLNLHSLTPATLALDQTNIAFATLSRAEWPAPEARLPMVYGVLPSLCVIVLSVLMRVCLSGLGPGYYGLGHVAADIAKETIAARMLKKLETLRTKNFVMHVRAAYKRWDRKE